MANPIVERTYIRIDGKLAAPLSAGSGQDEKTDHDMIRNQQGQPFVPGSSLAGAFLHQLQQLYPGLEDRELKKLFGTSIWQSRLIVYDMTLHAAELVIRDGVKLDSYKTAIDQAKYELEAVEREVSYTMRLEWIVRADSEKEKEKEAQWLYRIIDGLADGRITIGAKSNRGFGKITVDRVGYMHFNHRHPEESRKWLHWSWDQLSMGSMWERGNNQLPIPRSAPSATTEHCLTIPLAIDQTLMIRSYRVGDQPLDYKQLYSGSEKWPVIPGTTWAGALRSRLLVLLESFFPPKNKSHEQIVDELFGASNDKKGDEKASRILVEESVIRESRKLPVTRNAIDRFTGGTIKGALYSSEPIVGGHTELVLRWREGSAEGLSSKAIIGMLLWVVKDLQEGLLAVGGETAVGRGVFKENGAVQLDGIALKEESFYFREAAQAVEKRIGGTFA